MFDKMIAQQTAKKKKLLDNFLEKHEAEYPFPEDVELIQNIDYMGDGRPCHFMDVYRPFIMHRIWKWNIHCFNFRICKQFRIASVRFSETIFLFKLFCFFYISSCNCIHLTIICLKHSWNSTRLSDKSSSHNTPFNFSHSLSSLSSICIFYTIFIYFQCFFIAFCTTASYNESNQFERNFYRREYHERRTF